MTSEPFARLQPLHDEIQETIFEWFGGDPLDEFIVAIDAVFSKHLKLLDQAATPSDDALLKGPLKIYIASSWRKTTNHPQYVEAMLEKGYEVYDYRNPAQGNYGLYSWELMDPNWKKWDAATFRDNILNHHLANEAYALDYGGMKWADVCVLLLPSGKSAHLEAGWFAGTKKPLIVMLDGAEPELTYKMATKLCVTDSELFDELERLETAKGAEKTTEGARSP